MVLHQYYCFLKHCPSAVTGCFQPSLSPVRLFFPQVTFKRKADQLQIHAVVVEEKRRIHPIHPFLLCPRSQWGGEGRELSILQPETSLPDPFSKCEMIGGDVSIRQAGLLFKLACEATVSGGTCSGDGEARSFCCHGISVLTSSTPLLTWKINYC